jgi:hypothetical protein
MAVDTTLDVTVTWYRPSDGEDWDVARTLYAYLDPDTGEILYVGKADYCSARERANDHETDERFLERIGLDEWETIFGEVTQISEMERLSVPLLQDIEELLLWHLRPRGNRKFAEPRRIGLRVTCDGAWPDDEDPEFTDPG